MLLPVLLGPIVAGLGVALAMNFRGLTEWHARKTFQMMRPGGRSSPRPTPEMRLRRQVKLERAIGVVFAAVGLFMFVSGLVAWVV